MRERYNSKSLLNEFLRPPPMPGAAAAEGAAARAATRGAAAARGAARGAAEAAEARGVAKIWPYELGQIKIPKQTAVNSIAKTEKMNPALVNKDEFEEAVRFLTMEVQEIGQGVKSANPEEMKMMIWNGVRVRNPELADYDSPTLNPALYQIIDDYVAKVQEQPSETEKPIPFTVAPATETPEPQPIKLTVDTGIQGSKAETEMQPETKLDPLAQTIIASTLASSVGYKPQPLPQAQLSKVNQKFKTATKTAQTAKPNETVEEEEEFEPETPRRRREEEKDEEFDFDKDPLNQFLEKKKSFGEYSGVYGLK